MGNSTKTITVKTEGGDVIVRKLALRDYATLLRAFKKLPQELSEIFASKSDEEVRDAKSMVGDFFPILADSLEELGEILAVATDKDAEFFLAGDLADAIEVFVAVLELNNYQRIIDTIKKLTAGRNPASPNPAKNGSAS